MVSLIKKSSLYLCIDRFQQEDDSHGVREIYKGHNVCVSCIVYQEASEEYPSGLILAGCRDGTITAFQPGIEDLLYQLQGHVENIPSLFVSK